jgi:hypothetical protein
MLFAPFFRSETTTVPLFTKETQKAWSNMEEWLKACFPFPGFPPGV